MVSAVAHRDALADIAGAAHVREAREADAVAGVLPALVVAPATEAQVAAVLSWATRESLAVVVRGGGTKLDWGAPPRRCDVVLSTARLDAVVEHEPGDLVCVAQAGVRLDALQHALAAHRQALMLDPGQGVAATLGGIVAANASGPLRTRYGSARDLVIGARFVLADGTVGHSGGKVVKNVAGYDVAKLLTGSLGTLAVITELSLRLHPLPRATRTVAVEGLTAEAAADAWRAIEGASVVPAAALLPWPDGALLVRIDGTEDGVAAQVATLRHAQPGARPLDAEEAAAAWARASNVTGSPDTGAPVAAIAVPRTQLAALLDRLGTAAERAVVLPSLGVAEARLPADATPAQVTALRDWAGSAGGHLTLRRPSPAVAQVTWPDADGAALDLMRSVKHSLDPTATLAPGRFLGGI